MMNLAARLTISSEVLRGVDKYIEVGYDNIFVFNFQRNSDSQKKKRKAIKEITLRRSSSCWTVTQYNLPVWACQSR